MAVIDQEKAWAEQLKKTKANFKKEITLAMKCKTDKQKLKLYQRWQQQYSPIFVKELVSVARDKRIAEKIMGWEDAE